MGTNIISRSGYYYILVELGIQVSDIDIFRENCPQDTVRVIHKGLVTWRDRCHPDKAFKQLFGALEKYDRQDVVGFILKKCNENKGIEERSMEHRLVLPAPTFLEEIDPLPAPQHKVGPIQDEGLFKEKCIFQVLKISGELRTEEDNEYYECLLQSEEQRIRAFAFGLTFDQLQENAFYAFTNFYVKNIDKQGYDELVIKITERTIIENVEGMMETFKNDNDTIQDAKEKIEQLRTARTLSFEALVKEIDERPYRKRRSTPIPAKLLRVQDVTGQIDVKLWGDNANQEWKPNTGIKLTDGIINVFKGQYSLNVVYFSEVEELTADKTKTLQQSVASIPYTPIVKLQYIRAREIHEVQQPPTVPCEIAIQSKIKHIYEDSFLYRVCTERRHCKKLQVHPKGGYFCRECEEIYPLQATNANYFLKLLLKDKTGEIWVNCFDELSEQLLKMSADEFDEENKNVQNKIVQKLVKRQKEFLFTVKVTESTYEGEEKLDYILSDIKELKN